MASAPQTGRKTEVLYVADFTIDLRSAELRRNGSVVRLQRQPFQVLAHLAEHPGQIVTREDLRQLLWPADTAVDFDNSLNAAINKVREALGDSAEQPRFLETLPRRGYRFIADVSTLPSPAQSAPALQGGPATPAASSPHSKKVARWIVVVCAICVFALSFIAWRLLRKSPPSPEYAVEQITSNAEELPITGAALSPDGKYLAFSDAAGLYLRVVSTGETHALPLPHGLELRPDAWLPDSANFIATYFATSQPNEPPSLWVVPIVGTPRKFLDNAFAAAVSSDGSRAAFVRGLVDARPWAGKELLAGKEIWVSSFDGSVPRLQVKAEEHEWLGSPTWSPDSRRFAYLRSENPGLFNEKTWIEVHSAESGEHASVLNDTRLGNALLWAPDGQLLYTLTDSTKWGTAFVSWASPSYSIWSMPVSSSGPAPGNARKIANATGAVSRLSFAAATATFSFANEVKQTDVYVSELAGASSAGPPRRLTLSDANEVPLAWTADSRSVIFISDRNRHVNIYRQAIDASTAELIVGGNRDSWTPRLTPDGEHLLYSQMPEGTPEGRSDRLVRLMTVPLAGGSPQEVLRATNIGNFACGRNGTCLYDTGHNAELFLLDLNTGATRSLLQLKNDPAHCCAWNLSPDGSMLALAATVPKGNIKLFSIVDRKSRELLISNWSKLSPDPQQTNEGLDWAADGKGLYLTLDLKPGGWTLVYVTLDGRARVLLRDHNVRWAIPSPDGHYLALHTFSTVRNVWFAKLADVQ